MFTTNMFLKFATCAADPPDCTGCEFVEYIVSKRLKCFCAQVHRFLGYIRKAGHDRRPGGC